MNSAVGPSFKEKFTEIHTCESHDQCTGPIHLKRKHRRGWISLQSKLTHYLLHFLVLFMRRNYLSMFTTNATKLQGFDPLINIINILMSYD